MWVAGVAQAHSCEDSLGPGGGTTTAPVLRRAPPLSKRPRLSLRRGSWQTLSQKYWEMFTLPPGSNSLGSDFKRHGSLAALRVHVPGSFGLQPRVKNF